MSCGTWGAQWLDLLCHQWGSSLWFWGSSERWLVSGCYCQVTRTQWSCQSWLDRTPKGLPWCVPTWPSRIQKFKPTTVRNYASSSSPSLEIGPCQWQLTLLGFMSVSHNNMKSPLVFSAPLTTPFLTDSLYISPRFWRSPVVVSLFSQFYNFPRHSYMAPSYLPSSTGLSMLSLW